MASLRSARSARELLHGLVRRLPHAVLLLPILYLAAHSVWREGGPSFAAYRETWRTESLPLLVRTAGIAAGAAAVALLLGGFAGAVFERRTFALRGALRLSALLPLLLPPAFQVAVWERLARPGGLLTSILPFVVEPGRPFPIRNGLFAALILGASYSPVMFFLMSEGLRGIPRELIDAARIARGPWAVRLRILGPLAAPSVAAGAGVVFTLALLNYEVPRLLDVTTYPVLIQLHYGALDDPGMAFAAALPLFVLSAGVLLLIESWADRRGFSLTARESQALLRPERSAGLVDWCVVGGWWGFSVALPLGILATLVGRSALFAEAWITDGEKIVQDGLVCALAALMSAALAGVLQLPPPAEGGRARLSLWLPLALPGSLLGFALIGLCQRGPLFALYDSWGILVIASAARFFPIAYFLLRAQARTVPRDEWEAAELMGSPWRRWVRVRIPLVAPGLGAGAAAVALLSSAELPAALLLAPPGREPLIVRIYNLLHYHPERDVLAVLCLYHAASVLAVVALLLGLSRWVGGRKR